MYFFRRLCYILAMGSIVEIEGVRQRPEEGFRRWFSNNYFDLVFWYDRKDGVLDGLQFCYGKPHSEKAFTWESSTRSHHYVSEMHKGSSQATGILRGDAGEIPPAVIKRFLEEAPDLNDDLKSLVLQKIDEFNKKS